MTNLYSAEGHYPTAHPKEGICLELVRPESWSYPACLGMLVWGLRVIWIRYWLYWAFNKYAKGNGSQFWFKQWSLDIEIRNVNKHLYFFFLTLTEMTYERRRLCSSQFQGVSVHSESSPTMVAGVHNWSYWHHSRTESKDVVGMRGWLQPQWLPPCDLPTLSVPHLQKVL